MSSSVSSHVTSPPTPSYADLVFSPDPEHHAYHASHPFVWLTEEGNQTVSQSSLHTYVHHLTTKQQCKKAKRSPAAFGVVMNEFDDEEDTSESRGDEVHRHNEERACLVMGSHGALEIEMPTSSSHTFVVLRVVFPTIVCNNHPTRMQKTMLRFVTEEDMRDFIKLYFTFYHEQCDRDKRRWLQVAILRDDGWMHRSLKHTQTLEGLFLKTGVKETILDRIETFIKEEARCRRFGKPYKLNMLFYGVPGSGKTTAVKAIAKHLQRRLYIFNFSKSLTDSKLSEHVSCIGNKSMAVFEDVDSFFVQREAVGCNISFSSLINQLDGICNSDRGLITILTANHVDKLDPALLRQGRIDLIVHFDYPGKDEVHRAFDAYMDHLVSEKREELFKQWYPMVKNKQLPMSALTDFLFREYKNVLEKTPEFLAEHDHLKKIQSGVNDKMYL